MKRSLFSGPHACRPDQQDIAGLRREADQQGRFCAGGCVPPARDQRREPLHVEGQV